MDLNPHIIVRAREHAAGRASVQAGDALALIADDERFDAIWGSDVVWPGNFADPATAVAALAMA